MGAPSTAFVKQYEGTIKLLNQQMDSRMQAGCMVDMNWTGEEKYYDQYGTDDMVEIVSRLSDTPIQETDHRRRKVTPRYFVSNTLEDPFEALAMLADPKSTYMQAKRAAAGRKEDDIIIESMGGTSYSGKTGTTGNALTSANKVLVQAAGMTKAKILEGKKILDKAEIPKSERFMAYGADQLSDLLNTTEVGSSDYNTVKTLVEGDVNTWLGFTHIHTERLETDDSDDRLCYMWQKMGMQLAIQASPEGKLTERPDKNYAWQVYMKLALGSVRLEEDYVVQVACAE